ncbi:hypothetical protein, partial [Nocardiopsis protaetiae]|uniref:hypothetical protein n=1 Tax=Nocardiopsis protaetiae TaxID=3382270 RepID=UPI00387A9668
MPISNIRAGTPPRVRNVPRAARSTAFPWARGSAPPRSGGHGGRNGTCPYIGRRRGPGPYRPHARHGYGARSAAAGTAYDGPLP